MHQHAINAFALSACASKSVRHAFSKGVMQDVAVLWERSKAPRMTVISSSLRSPPNPYSVPWMSSMAFSCDLLNSACRNKSSNIGPHSDAHAKASGIYGTLRIGRWWAEAWGQRPLL